MSAAYVDSSCLIAIAFGKPGSERLAKRLEGYDQLLSANLLEAEVLSALQREELDEVPDFLGRVSWVLPDRALTTEIARVLSAGQLRSAALWHVACALYISPDPGQLPFHTLDERQRGVAESLGFPVG